jgi:hypothetical protein
MQSTYHKAVNRSILASHSSISRAELFGFSSEVSQDGCIEIKTWSLQFLRLCFISYIQIHCMMYPGDGNDDQGTNEDTMAKHLSSIRSV